MPRGVNRYDEAKLQGRLWTPKVLRPGLWYSPNKGAVGIGTGISSLQDLSGNGRTLSQATGAKQPAYASRAWRSFAAARFDGTDDILQATVPTGISDTTQFLVGRFISGGANEDLVLGYGVSGSTGRGRWFYRTPDAGRLGFATWTVDLSESASTTVDIGGGYHVWGVRQAGKSLLLSIDGVEESNSLGTGTLSTTNSAVWSLGGVTPGTVYFANVDVLEVISFPVALSINDFRKVNGALAWEYGLQDRMPADHHFSTRPPLIGD